MKRYHIFIIWIVFLLSAFLISILGVILYKKTPKPNTYFGYKTKKALSSQELWTVANKLFGKCLLISGIILFFILIPILYFTIPNYYLVGCIISAILLLFAVILSIVIVEFRIRKIRLN